MLGDLISETRGKRTVRRALSTDPLTVEISFEDGGKLSGVDANGFGTYTVVVRPDGSLYGEGEGASITQEGDMATWKGSGLGKFTADGGVSYRGMMYFRSASPKLARLNNVATAFEYDADATGISHMKAWEWK